MAPAVSPADPAPAKTAAINRIGGDGAIASGMAGDRKGAGLGAVCPGRCWASLRSPQPTVRIAVAAARRWMERRMSAGWCGALRTDGVALGIAVGSPQPTASVVGWGERSDAQLKRRYRDHRHGTVPSQVGRCGGVPPPGQPRRMASKNSPLLFVALILSSRNSIASRSSMLYSSLRRIQIFCRISGFSSNSSRRVPERFTLIAG
jgi:hypothetical protein